MVSQILSSSVWQTVAALIGIIAVMIAIIRHIYKLPTSAKVKNFWYVITISLTVLLIIGTSWTIFLLSSSKQSSIAPLSPTTIPTFAAPSSSPSNIMTVQPTVQLTETPPMQPTPTDTPSPVVPTLPPTPGLATKAMTLPFVMNCECASNPVQVRVTGVHIQQSLGSMTWDLTLLNVGTDQLDVEFRQIGLALNGQISLAQGPMVEGGTNDSPVPLAPNGQSGDIAQSTITFTFVPQQGTYMLKAIMDLCPTVCDSVFYNGTNGIPFTFQ
jgi:hypothetical protein